MKKLSLLIVLLSALYGLNAQKRLTTAKMTNGIYSIFNVGLGKYMEVNEAWTAPFDDEKIMTFSSSSNNPDSYFFIDKKTKYFTIQPMNCKCTIGPSGKHHLIPIVVTHTTNNLTACDLLFEPVPGKKETYYIKVPKRNTYLIGCKNTLNTNHNLIETNTYVDESSRKIPDNTRQQWKLVKLSDHYAYVNPNQKFMIKSATSDHYWDLKGDSDNSTNKNGTTLWLSREMLHTNDKRYKLKRDQGNWVYIQVQNGGRNINVDKGNLNRKGQPLELWDRKSDLTGQRFAIIPTSPTTCVIVTYTGLALQDIDRKIKQTTLNFTPRQHWKLIYADGPNKGKTYSFKKD
ncbi:hypothetical protein DMA11_21730 [Marinilabiliaceae bacterium JC017]|nr:hypothetical protein DMA11_21730 [Marinilabiliaceae bacterium JC017]